MPHKDINRLFDHSQNWRDNDGNPWCVFLDLTNYAQENFGEPLSSPFHYRYLGDLERELIAKALLAFVKEPETALEIIWQLETETE